MHDGVADLSAGYVSSLQLLTVTCRLSLAVSLVFLS